MATRPSLPSFWLNPGRRSAPPGNCQHVWHRMVWVLTLSKWPRKRCHSRRKTGLVRGRPGCDYPGRNIWLAPGLVRQAGNGPISLEAHPRLAPFQDMLVQAGFDVQVVDDVQSLLWSKLVVSSAIKPLDGFVANKKRGIAQPSYAGDCWGGRPRDRLGGRNAGRGFAIPGPRLCHRRGGLAHSGRTLRPCCRMFSVAPYRDRCDQWGDCSEGGRRGLILPVNRVLLSLVKALSVRGKI